MTVATEISANEYTGNGVTTEFDYKFRVFKESHLNVTVSDSAGDDVITLRLGTDYSVTGVKKSSGGKVILTRPLANGSKIAIVRELPITQETSFRNQSKFFAETHEDAFDYLTMLLQRMFSSLNSLYLKRPSFLANWFDAKGYRIANLGKPKHDRDAVNLGSMNEAIAAKDKRSLRVADMDIPALPKASERADKVLTFDKNGVPQVIAPASGSAVDVLNQLGRGDGLSWIGGCDSINDLRVIAGVKDGDQVFLKSYHFGKNKGGDIFKWRHSSKQDDDSGCVIKPFFIDTGRWVRVEHDRYTPEMYGADGTRENDPSAIHAILNAQKRILFVGEYYYNSEFVTNGHDITGASPSEHWSAGIASKVIFFGGFSAKQAVRNEKIESNYSNIVFEPDSWNEESGYTGTGLRLDRKITAVNCKWIKFKEFGADLWEVTSPDIG